MAIKAEQFKTIAGKLLEAAAVDLPTDVLDCLKKCGETEDAPLAKKQFETIISNCSIANERHVGLCQDNGLVNVFLRLGQNCKIEGDFQTALDAAVAEGTKGIPLRENVIHPLTKKNTGTNVGPNMPYLYWEMVPDCDYLEVTVAPKGFGAEFRMAQSWVLTSEDIKEAVKRLALESVRDTMGEPCPPVIMGIAVGGTFDVNAVMAKKALFRTPLGSSSDDPDAAELEREIFKSINGLGLGPMGFGGKNYLLAVHMEVIGSHTAIVPVTIGYQCWAHRYSTARIYDDGRVEYLTHPYLNDRD